MPIGNPRDAFFYPTLTLMIDSYILLEEGSYGPGQGSNLALAYLLNASSFLQKPSLAIFSMWKQVALKSTQLCNTAYVVCQTV